MSERRTLVVGPSWVGDMVMAQCLFKVLRNQAPDVPIDVLAPPWSEPILMRMPEVAASISMTVGHGRLALGTRWRLARALSTRRYTQAIVLPNSLKSVLIPAMAGIPLRTGWRGEMRFGLLNDIRLLDKKRYPLMIERFAALAFEPNATLPEPLPRPELRSDPKQQQAAIRDLSLAVDRPVLALCPGAEFGPAKRWPEGHYRDVAKAVIEQGWQVWLFGSANDRGVTKAIADGLDPGQVSHCHDLAGRTSLGQAIDLLALADRVVSNDSGLMHIAAALGRPLVVLYGATSPGFTPPLTDVVEILSIPVDCGPCFERVCPLGHGRCLQDIAPRRVLDALDRLPQPAALK